MNTYVVVCEATRISAIVDPGADAEDILALAEGTRVIKILLTHGHPDHTGALARVREVTGAQVYLHPADAEEFDVDVDLPLRDGEEIAIGKLCLRAIHVPGHTPGTVCLSLNDGRILVGDTLFCNGPGHTKTPEDFMTTMKNLQAIVFKWPDDTVFFPGHGESGVIGQERPRFEVFVSRGWPPDLHGDVTWE
ncbi:MAG: MBL fold metallo-hydrolase [Chloroflexota bacterium]